MFAWIPDSCQEFGFGISFVSFIIYTFTMTLFYIFIMFLVIMFIVYFDYMLSVVRVIVIFMHMFIKALILKFEWGEWSTLCKRGVYTVFTCECTLHSGSCGRS
jgi:hypothetical protein